MDDWLETSPPTNKSAKKTNRLSLRTPSRDVTKLDGDKNWLKAHEMSLLECGFQFVGSHKPEERFSRDEIIDELISTFPCEGQGNSESLGSGGFLFQTGYRLNRGY